MERNRGEGSRGNYSGKFSQRNRNDDFQNPWLTNFSSNPYDTNGNRGPQMQNIPQQSMQNSPWMENQSFQNSEYRQDPWHNNSNNWNQNRSANNYQSWSQNAQQDNGGNGYWRQVSGFLNERDSGAGHSKNYNRERRTPYERPQGGPSRNRANRREAGGSGRPGFNNRESSPENGPVVPLSPLEAKIEHLISAVQSQPDNIGQIILLQSNNEIPPVLLHNAVHQVKDCELVIDRDESNGYSKLRINNTVLAEGIYSSKKDAKEALYEMGLEILKSKCFYITSKSHYEEVSMDDLSNQKAPEPENTIDSSSKALQMMLKMGWGGKGLGTKEQGEQKSVADKIVENISREGLGGGGKTVLQEVDKILADYARSNKTTTLGFDSGFTKEERAQIHSMAARYHLKSKSEGGFKSRRITVFKKFSKWVLIRELLSTGLENQSYVLTIPDEYLDLWKDDDGKTHDSQL